LADVERNRHDDSKHSAAKNIAKKRIWVIPMKQEKKIWTIA